MTEGDAELEFRILGPLEARRGGEVVALGAPKQRALLALLLLRAGEVVSTDRLIDELWGEAPPQGAAHTVQVFVSRLRKALGADALLTRAPGYAVTGEVDVGRFRSLASAARVRRAAGDSERALAGLREALSLWRGPPLAEFAYEPFAAPHIERLEEERLAVDEERLELELELGHHARLVGELEELCHVQPLRERPHALLMLALYRSGRQSEALDAYRQLRGRLDDELGLEPSVDLQTLERQILQQDPTLAADPPRRRPLPHGTVTFLFTDIEGSTRLLDEVGIDVYAASLAEHRRVLREAFDRHQGVEVDVQGDSFCVAFRRAQDALAAAVDAQAALQELPIRIRIGVHTGEPIVAEEGYVGMDVHRAARIMSAGHGGQIVVSETTRNLVDGAAGLRDLGSHLLKDMTAPQRLYQLGDGDFPPLRSLDRTNLPVPMTPLVGRKVELVELAGLLAGDNRRLVTLTGAGGTGKTRLALELARQLSADFLDGVFFVELAAISDPVLLVPTIAGVLELAEQPGQNLQQTLAQALRERELLLLLDNLEQLPGAAPLLAELLSTCPRLVLLVTSRSPLHLSGERLYPLGPLPASDAFALLVARAQAANPGFASTGENRVALEAICARLDGLPLALELAAARLKLLSPEALLLRLERSLELLVDGARDLPERQQALRSTIAWSDGLLSASERSFFHRLAVFRGGCTLEAAEAICNPGGELGDSLTLAETLLDASLVQAQAATDEEPRLQLLQTIREYAAEALAAEVEEELVRSRHCEYFLLLAERADPELSGPDQTRWMTLLEQEQDNFREALALAANTPETGQELRMVGALAFFWSVRGRHLAEGRRRLDQALARAGSSSAALRAKALRQNAWIAIRQGQLDDARPLAEEAVEIYRSLGDASGTHNTLDALAAVLIETGETAKARPVLEESLALARTLGNENYVAATLNNLASLALVEQEYERARELATESLESFTELGSSYGSAIALYHIGAAQAQQGAFDQALPSLRESLRLSDELGDDEGVIFCLEAVALLTAVGGEPAPATELLGCAEARAQEIGVKRAQFEQLMRDRALAAARERLGAQEFASCWTAGQRMTIDEAVASVRQADSRQGGAAAGRVPSVD